MRIEYEGAVTDRVPPATVTHADLLRSRAASVHPSTILVRLDAFRDRIGPIDEAISGELRRGLRVAAARGRRRVDRRRGRTAGDGALGWLAVRRPLGDDDRRDRLPDRQTSRARRGRRERCAALRPDPRSPMRRCTGVVTPSGGRGGAFAGDRPSAGRTWRSRWRAAWSARPPSNGVRTRGGAVSSEVETVAAPAASEPAPELRQLARGGTLNLVGFVLSGLFAFALAIVVTRLVGAHGAGTFFAAVAVFTILSNITELGADTGIVRYVARLREQRRGSELASLMRIALIPAAVLATVAGAATVIWAVPLADVFSRSGSRRGGELSPRVRVVHPAGHDLARSRWPGPGGSGRCAPSSRSTRSRCRRSSRP